MIAPLKVSEGIWRGPQPSNGDWVLLRDITANYPCGIRTVLKLNYEDEGSDAGATRAGLKVYTWSMPPKDFIGALGEPDIQDVMGAVGVLANENNRPIYVHCLHGQDRCGLVVGIYRVMHEGWTCDRAFKEMLALGFHWELPDLMRTWWEFYVTRWKLGLDG